MEQDIHQQQTQGTMNAAPTPPEAYPPRSDKLNADTQEMSNEVAEIFRLPETETLLTHCKCSPCLCILNKHSNDLV